MEKDLALALKFTITIYSPPIRNLRTGHLAPELYRFWDEIGFSRSALS
jgi:hypothetical protein